MNAIAINEFKKLFFSIKSLIIVFFFVSTSYYGVNFIVRNFPLIPSNTNYYSILRFLIFFLGYIFISILSNDCINTELKYKTIRLIISKVSRIEFLVGKILGVFSFWILCIFISFCIISIFSKTLNFSVFLYLIFVVYYYISINLFLSTVILNSTYSNLIGFFIGIILPILGVWLFLSEEWYSIFSYLFSYNIKYNFDLRVICSLMFSILLNYITYIILKRKDF